MFLKTYASTTIIMKSYIFILFFILFTFDLSAQVKKWTLQECVEYALENNISVKNSELDMEMTDIEKNDAFGSYLPALNASASNSWNTGLTQDVTTGILKNFRLPIVSINSRKCATRLHRR